MRLFDFWVSLSRKQQEEIAKKCNASWGHIRNVAVGIRGCGASLAAAIEVASGFQVTRQELRPHDWQEIWPELAAQKLGTKKPPTGQRAKRDAAPVAEGKP